MYILISSIIFAIFFVAYSCWIYIKSSILPVERFKSNEILIENIKMQQFFHFIDIETFNKNKISKEFLESCEKAGKLFKQSKKEESQGRDLPSAQPHETRCKELCETREREVSKES